MLNEFERISELLFPLLMISVVKEVYFAQIRWILEVKFGGNPLPWTKCLTKFTAEFHVTESSQNLFYLIKKI